MLPLKSEKARKEKRDGEGKTRKCVCLYAPFKGHPIKFIATPTSLVVVFFVVIVSF